MALSHRQKLTIISLLLYWPTIFILTHMPLARVPWPCWVVQAPMPDKIFHYLAYLVLVFLLWFAISPNKKVNWRKAAVWWVLFVVVWYGVVDEVLQGYVGRTCDVMDFFADLGGTLTSLILLTIFSFWSASLVVTGAIIFVLTNFIRADTAELPPVINAAFHLFAYGFFTMLWIRYIHHFLPIKASQPKWLIGASAMPIGFLLAVELFSAVAGGGFRLSCVIISAVGIAAVVIAIHLIALCRKVSLTGFRGGLTQNDS